jgi:hypothetical protein
LVPVRLRHGQVDVERRPDDGPLSEADVRRMREGEPEVTETVEEPGVGREGRVVEEGARPHRAA